MALAPGTGDDEDLADDEVRVVEPVGREDVRRVDVVSGGERVERVGRGDRDDEAGHGRDPQDLAGLERSFDFRSFAHQTDIIETPNFEAIPTSVSPATTV